jgi:NAD(P)-dependent dehydrogenase (short-subunit alcohol dehydrogenase family)
MLADPHAHLSLRIIPKRSLLDLITDAKKSEWLNMFEVNVVAMVLGIKHLTPHLRRSSDATVVNMSSISAQIGTTGYAAYVATKGAVDSLTKALALELAPASFGNSGASAKHHAADPAFLLVVPPSADQHSAMQRGTPAAAIPHPVPVVVVERSAFDNAFAQAAFLGFAGFEFGGGHHSPLPSALAMAARA